MDFKKYLALNVSIEIELAFDLNWSVHKIWDFGFHKAHFLVSFLAIFSHFPFTKINPTWSPFERVWEDIMKSDDRRNGKCSKKRVFTFRARLKTFQQWLHVFKSLSEESTTKGSLKG